MARTGYAGGPLSYQHANFSGPNGEDARAYTGEERKNARHPFESRAFVFAT